MQIYYKSDYLIITSHKSKNNIDIIKQHDVCESINHLDQDFKSKKVQKCNAISISIKNYLPSNIRD